MGKGQDKPATQSASSIVASAVTTLPYAKIAFGMLIAAALLGVSFVVLRQTFQESANYYQKRDLRMLERVGRDITNGVEGLGIAAGLHFDPHAMRFSLSPLGRCLVGTIWVPFDRRDRIKIDYNFVDPLRTEAWLQQMAAQDATGLKAAGATASVAPPLTHEPNRERCQLRRPPGEARPAGAVLDRQIEVDLYLPVTQLLGAGTPPRREPAGRHLTIEQPTDANAEVRSTTVQAQLEAGAVADLRTSGEAGAETTEIIRSSIQTAFKSNLIRVSATRDAPEIGATAAAARFAMIKLFSAAQEGKPRTLLWQTGEAPPLLDQSKLTDVDRTALGILGVAGTPSKEAAKQEQADKDKAEAQAFAAPAASVTRIGNLVLYQRDYVGPNGLDCPKTNPCKLVAVRDAAAVDTEARRVDGIRAIWLLIGILTAIGCLPLLQLFLNKRLDPIDRLGQYMLWLSLSFLAASATVTAMALLASGASIAAGNRAADKLAKELSWRLATELGETVPRVRCNGGELAAARTPPAEPFESLAPRRRPAAAKTRAMLVDAVVLFDALGLMAENKPTMTLLAAPTHAASVFDRRYFRAAATGDLIRLPGLPPFTIEQLFSKPDGVRKTAIATPLSSFECGERSSTGVGAKTAAGRRHRTSRSLPARCRHSCTSRRSPGLAYAVVDRSLSDGPDVLFHSDRSNELVSRFIDDVDDGDTVTRLIQRAGPAGGEALATHYQSRPVRLHATLLVPGLPWVLVAIEDRDQAGYGVWRDVVTGYSAWFLVTGGVGLLLLPGFLIWRKGFNRQPAMWLWPDRILTQWRSRFRRDRVKKLRLERVRRAYTERALAALLGVPVAILTPEPARIPISFVVVILAASVRGSLGGRLACNAAEARRIDRWTAVVGIGLCVLAIAALGVAADAGRSDPQGDPAWRWLLGLLFSAIALSCFAWDLRVPAAAALGIRRPLRLGRWRRSWKRWRGLQRGTWVMLLLAASVTPAASGFLDSHASNWRWANSEWNAARTAFYGELEDRRRAIQHSFDSRYFLAHDDTHVTLLGTLSQRDESLLTQGVHLLGLDEKVRQSSRMLPTRWTVPAWHWVLAALLPFLALCGPLLLFRLQFFQRSETEPLASPGLRQETLPLAIEAVEKHALYRFAPPPPAAPFGQSFARRHLIVGAGAKEEYDAGLLANRRIAHVDLLDPDEPVLDAKNFGVVLIHGFNAALLHASTYHRALQRMEALVRKQERPEGQEERPDGEHLHLFLFAASEPTDRILATYSLREERDSDDLVSPAYRWAEILDSFSLYNLAPDGAIDAPTLFQRELKVVGSRAAELLLAARADFETKPDDKLIPFLTDFLADHYKLLWETSSRDEQIILYEIACGSHLKMRDSFALRSLEARRLVTRAPEYQLMNQSFTRYVRQVGRPVELRRAAREEGGTDRLFPLLQIPVAILLGSGLLLLLLVTPGETGFATALPALAAALPSLVATWLRGGRPATG